MFATDFGDAFFRPEIAFKRESGVNPEQTRCCKLHQKSLNNTNTTVGRMTDGKAV